MESQGTTVDSDRNQQLGPDFAALGVALAPLIGAWPKDMAALRLALWRAGVAERVEDEGIDLYEPGRQPVVEPRVHSSRAFPDGFVWVLDAPEYISPDLIHALPDPALSEHLGGVVQRRKVPVDRRALAPAPGRCWYAVVTVPRLGRRLRLWDSTNWWESDEMTDADCAAFVSWWNSGVDGGWGTFSKLNDDDCGDYFDSVPASVLAQLRRTPALEAWLNERTSTAAAPQVHRPE